MIDLRIFANSTVDALAWTLLHFLWQGALLGFAAFFLLRLARPERASTRYAIGVATLGLMLVSVRSRRSRSSRSAPADRRDQLRRSVRSPARCRSSMTSVDETVNDVRRTRNEQSIDSHRHRGVRIWRPAPLGPTATFVLVLAWGIGVLALSLRLLGGWMLTRSLTRHAVSAVSPAIIAAAGDDRRSTAVAPRRRDRRIGRRRRCRRWSAG